MTHSQHRFSRRNMFSVAAGGASALALGHVFTGPAHAAPTSKVSAAKLKQIQQLRAIESGLRPGALAVPGDLKLDPQTLALAEKLLARAKQSVLIAATRPKEAPKGDKVIAAASKIVGTLRSKRVTRMRSSLNLAEVQAGIGPAAQMQAKQMPDYTMVELKKTVDLSKLKKQKEQPKWSGPLVKRIEFQLNSVKCVEETSGESGSDEILLGGNLITPGGVVKKVDRFKVSDDFDDGESVYYDFELCNAFPPGEVPYFIKCKNGGRDDVYRGRKLEATLLGEGIPWPATIGLVLVMGEEDPGGGFGSMLQDIYAALEEEIDKQLGALGTEAGAAIGGDLGAAVGAALAYAAGEFLDWLVSLFDNADDLVASKNWTIQLASPELDKIRTLSNDNLPAPASVWASPMKTLHFNGDGGRYDMRLHWRVNT